MRDTGLLTCPRTGQDRTLYSLRHTYATFSLLNDGMDVHTLAVQMGTSILMIERHYSHLTPRLKKEMLTGKRYDTPYEEYKAERVQGFSISDDDLHSPVEEVIEESLPNEPEEQPDIRLAVMLYVRFPLSLRNVEDLLHAPMVLPSQMKIYSAQLMMWRLKKSFPTNQKQLLWPSLA